MSAARKTPDGPDMGGLKDDWGRLAEMRRQEHAPAAAEDPPAAAPAAPVAEQPRQQPMTRRSWYVEREAAEALSAAVDDIHHATRVPKHVVASALFRAAAAQADQVAADLSSHASHG